MTKTPMIQRNYRKILRTEHHTKSAHFLGFLLWMGPSLFLFQASDGISVAQLCCKLLEVHKQKGQWGTVNEFVIALCKKRGQLKRAISDMITLGINWLDETPNRETKVKLIQTLASIAEGKVPCG